MLIFFIGVFIMLFAIFMLFSSPTLHYPDWKVMFWALLVSIGFIVAMNGFSML